MKTVFVGLSGGVDSSVSASILKRQGFRVVGVYMKNWSQDIPGFECPWKEDYLDAKRVAVQLGIEFDMFDFEAEYKQKVVDYMIDEYRLGRTPNPDIMCNQEIKFKLFYHVSKDKGADYIATGHYAKTSGGNLYMAKDQNKDQTYFLYRLKKAVLGEVIFPIGDLTKSEVRQKATELGLATASKKESMGICFVGKVGIKEFLSQYVEAQRGPVIDQNGEQVGEHDGAIFYTIGQRHGLGIGGGMPYYVVDKNMDKNEVYVSNVLDDQKLWKKEINIIQPHWLDKAPEEGQTYKFRVRHRASLVTGRLKGQKSIVLDEPIRAVTAGQSIVVYDGQLVLGGGIISS